MATLSAPAGNGSSPIAQSLGGSQTGNGVSNNVIDTGVLTRSALLKILTTVGATPTCTYQIEGSADLVDWFPVTWADPATPRTLSEASFVITAALTTLKIIQPGQPFRYLRITYSANTNVTNSSTLLVF